MTGLNSWALALFFLLFALSLISYCFTVRTIWRLVDDVRKDKPDRTFSRFWWLPAWTYHRRAFPLSPLRKQIVTRFILTFFLMMLAMFIYAYSDIRTHGWPAQPQSSPTRQQV